MRTIIGILIALPSVIHAQSEKAEFADLGEAAWRCAYLAAWSEDDEEAERLFDIGKQAYRAWLSMPAATAPPPTQGRDEPSAEMRPEMEAAIERAGRRASAQHPSFWGSEQSPDFKLGRLWQEVTDEAFKSLKTHTDWDAEAKRSFEQENCAWIK